MPTTDHFYGGRTLGARRTIQDFGLCDLKGAYTYTTKARAKGFLVVVFFTPDSPASVRALKAVQEWAQTLPAEKWSAIAVTDGAREEMTAFAEQNGLDKITIVLDYELYQTRQWGVSNLPSTYVIAGKTGEVLAKVLGDGAGALEAARETLETEIAKVVAAEEAARRAEEEKKAAEAAKAAAGAPAEPAKK